MLGCSGSMPWRKASSGAAPAVCACERGERQPVYPSVCAPVFGVCVPFSQLEFLGFEMQHLQMCLVNCSPQLHSHSEGTIETKQLKCLSTWGRGYAAWVCLLARECVREICLLSRTARIFNEICVPPGEGRATRQSQH